LIEKGAAISRPDAHAPEPSVDVGERQQRVATLVARLTGDVPADITARTAEQQAHWILAHTVNWHRREQKSAWWEYFRLADLPAEDLMDERDALSGLNFMATTGGTTRAPVHRYRFPPQEVELRGGESPHTFGGVKLGKVDSISLEGRTVDIKKRQDSAQVHPDAFYAHDVVSTEVMSDALLRIGDYVAANGLVNDGAYQAARDLLLRQPPELGGDSLHTDGETTVEAAVRIAPKLASGVLAIQGPPGAGKTFTAARMICALVRAHRRVGVTANSHKVIRNLLDEIVRAADEFGIRVQCIQKVADKQDDVHGIQFSTSNDAVLAALGPTCQVAGGTAWFWSRPEAFRSDRCVVRR
jgi:uncharacterized protein